MRLYKKYGIEDIVAFIITTVLVSLLILAYLAYIGFIFQTMWGWFVVPLGAPPLVLPQATGIVLMVTLPFLHSTKRDDEGSGKTLLPFVLYPLFAFLLGYLFHLMM